MEKKLDPLATEPSLEEQVANLKGQLTAQGLLLEETIAAHKVELDAKELALAAALDPSAPHFVRGSYNGYTFAPGHVNVRDRQGLLCDTALVLDSASKGDQTAIDLMEWLIEIEYGYLILA
jgi:hypothetical protein